MWLSSIFASVGLILKKDEFVAAYIAGAVKIPYPQFRPSKNNTGSLIDISALERILEEVEVLRRDNLVSSPTRGKTRRTSARWRGYIGR